MSSGLAFDPRPRLRIASKAPMPRVRHTASVPLDFMPHSLMYDVAHECLFITDVTHDRLLAWDGHRFDVIAELAAEGELEYRGLGQIARTPEGDLLVPRYGYGAHGAIFRVSLSGARLLPDIDPTRKRLGLAVSPSGDIFEAYFIDAEGFRTGAVAHVGMLGGEHDLVAGLKKPTSIVAEDDEIFVADHARSRILRIPSSPSPIFTSFAAVEGPEGMTRGPDGTLLISTKRGAVVIAGEDGATRDLVVGLSQPRGLAFDGRSRLFVADLGPSKARPRTPMLRVIEVDFTALRLVQVGV